MFDFLLKGGFLMWPILVCSIIAVTIILERFYYLYSLKPAVTSLVSRVRNLLKEEKIEEAIRLCENFKSPVAHILAIGIRIRRRSHEEKERMFSRAGSKILRKLEKNISGLEVIANSATLLGLLGTVTGMIRVFMKIQESGGHSDASMLAGGIWEALLTTAAGLFVAIPASLFYHYFEGRVDELAGQMKDAAGEFLEYDRI